MSDRFALRLAQIDPVVGALDANAEAIRAVWARARAAGEQLVVTPEMSIAGYQVQDLALKPAFVADCRAVAERLAAECADGPALLVGLPWARSRDGRVVNGCALLEGGRIGAVIEKRELPNYGVFDEKRLFAEGPPQGPIAVGGVRIGVAICEDAWLPETAETLTESGAELLLVPNGSPYARGKHEAERMPQMVARVIECRLPLVYLNMVGAQDDQVFDGGSFALDLGGALALQAPFFEPAEPSVTFRRGPDGALRPEPCGLAPVPQAPESDYRAMVEGLRAYMRKNGFAQALLGLSGGVDSALVAAIAADAIGPEAVRCVMLPSRFTSRDSLEDAAAVAAALGVRLDRLSIGSAVETVEAALAPLFEGRPRDLTEENLQSRLRGLYLMALSNKTGALLLTTGNKSEVAVGYATLYGDMCGGYNPVKDLYKTRLFETARWRNAHHAAWMRGPAGAVLPDRVLTKAPTAELRENQKDEDSLPPYPVLDAILELLIEGDLAAADIVARGFDAAIVARVEQLVALSEYKRHQAAPGPKLSSRAFWLERRYPLTNRWTSAGRAAAVTRGDTPKRSS